MSDTLAGFSKSLIHCGLIVEAELRTFLDGLPQNTKLNSAEELARELVRARKLTKFQAQAILQGKTNGLVLGNYVVIDKIGQGGMGCTVFKARHQRMDRIVALKVLPTSAIRSSDAVKRFQQEVKAAAKLSHPNIVTSHDADEARGVYFLVMEYVEGKDLAVILREAGLLPIAKAIDYIEQTARGLEYAHAEGVVHRDIKPLNLLLDKRGIVKILDMGLARIEQTIGSSDKGLTQSGQVMGTMDYMAPEQALDSRNADARADIYSLGCTLWFLLTGHPVYDGDTMMQKIFAHRDREIPSLRTVRADVPHSLERVFKKMLAKRPEERFQSMTEVLIALQDCRPNHLQESRYSVNGSQPTANFVAAPYIDSSQPETVSLRQANVETSSSHLEVPIENTTLTEDLVPTRANSIVELVINSPCQSSVTVPVTLPQRLASQRRAKISSLSSVRIPPIFTLSIGTGFAFMAILFGIVISLRTREGTLVLELSETDVNVEILSADGKLEIERKGDKEKLVIAIDPGNHRSRLTKGGTEVFAKEFTMASGGKEVITARFVTNDTSSIPKIEPTFVEEFNLEQELVSTDLVHAGYKEGTYYIDSRQIGNGHGASSFHEYTDGTIEITARVGKGCLNGWVVVLANRENKHGVQLCLFGDGRILVGPSMYDPVPSIGPSQRWITNSAVQSAGQWNTLRLVIKKNTLEIHANSKLVCEPLELAFELSPGGLMLGQSDDNGMARVEYERYSIWPTTDVTLLPVSSSNAHRE